MKITSKETNPIHLYSLVGGIGVCLFLIVWIMLSCFFSTSVAGAGLTGSKMATRIGSLEEFEFKEVGGDHQGVSSKFHCTIQIPCDYWEGMCV